MSDKDDLSILADDQGGNDPQTPEVKFDELVGENKKYRDPDSVAKAVVEKDTFIEHLQAQLEEMRTDLKSRTTVEELLEKLGPKDTPAGGTKDTAPGKSDVDDPDAGSSPKHQEDIAKLVKDYLSEERSRETKASNVAKAKQGLAERFGANYNTKLQEAANALEVSVDFLNDMATSSPDGLLRLVDSVVKKSKDAAPPRNTVSGPMPDSGRKNRSFYNSLRKQNPNLYFSPSVQLEMYREAKRQGEDFYK